MPIVGAVDYFVTDAKISHTLSKLFRRDGGSRADISVLSTRPKVGRFKPGETGALKSIQYLYFTVFLIFIGVYSLAFELWLASGVSPWIVGDWLINYSGGFVRRGLEGSVVLLIGHLTRIPLNLVVYGMQSVVFVLFLWLVWRLVQGIRWTFLMAAVLLSPATLEFSVLDYSAGFRKEILLFAALALVIYVLEFHRLSDLRLSALLTIIAVGLTLSHEALLVGTPYFFAAVAICGGLRALKIYVTPLILGLVSLIAVYSHPGSVVTAQAICSSVGGKFSYFPVDDPSSVCSGSIEWLQATLPQARAVFFPTLHNFHFARFYGLLAIPTFAPLFAQLIVFYRRDGLHRAVMVTFWSTSLALGATAVLLYSGMDWGRWIHMQAMCLMLMLLMIEHEAEGKAAPIKPLERPLRYASALALFLYSTIWTLPFLPWGPHQGYLDVARGLRYMGRNTLNLREHAQISALNSHQLPRGHSAQQW